jgi:hypothetical protein
MKKLIQIFALVGNPTLPMSIILYFAVVLYLQYGKKSHLLYSCPRINIFSQFVPVFIYKFV